MLFSVAIASSCAQEDGTKYSAANNEAYFVGSAGMYAFGATDPTEYAITLKRFVSGGATTVPVTVTDESGLFTVPATVEFANGSVEGSKLVVTFDRSKLTTGQVYSITVKVAEHLNPIPGYAVEYKLNIMRDYVWQPYATGTIESEVNEDSWSQPIEKAEGVEVYRLPDLYEPGYPLIFSVAADGSITLIPKEEVNEGTASAPYYCQKFTTGMIHPSYGMMWLNVDVNSDDEGGFWSYFDTTNKEATINGILRVSAGNFGWYNEVLTW